MPPGRVYVAVVIAALLWGLVWWGYAKAKGDAVEDTGSPILRKAILAIAILSPALLIAFAWWSRVDGFSLGAIAIAIILEAFIFVGWITSPQSEPPKYFAFGTMLPLIFVAVTLWFHQLQKEA